MRAFEWDKLTKLAEVWTKEGVFVHSSNHSIIHRDSNQASAVKGRIWLLRAGRVSMALSHVYFLYTGHRYAGRIEEKLPVRCSRGKLYKIFPSLIPVRYHLHQPLSSMPSMVRPPLLLPKSARNGEVCGNKSNPNGLWHQLLAS